MVNRCPTGALTVEERDADFFDEEAVNAHMSAAATSPEVSPGASERQIPPLGGCPGMRMRKMSPEEVKESPGGEIPSQLSHWPIQLSLVSPGAGFLQNADLLLVADCVPFALPDFHQRFLQGGHPVIICCPKLDDTGPYITKLNQIIQTASLRSLTIIHMEVPCCSGLCGIVKESLKTVDSAVNTKEITISIDGKVVAKQGW